MPTDQVTLKIDLDDLPQIATLLADSPWWGNRASPPAHAWRRWEGPGWCATYYAGSGTLLIQGKQTDALAKAIVKLGEDEREAFLYRASLLLQRAVGSVLADVRVVRDEDDWWLQVTNNDGEVKRIKEG